MEKLKLKESQIEKKDSMSGYQLWQKHKERVLNNDSIDH